MGYVTVDVDVNDVLDNLSNEDLKEEVEARGFRIEGFEGDRPIDELINKIYENMILKKPYEEELRNLIYIKLGKIV